MTLKEKVTARYQYGQVHWFPNTVGCPDDGSLYGQRTACGRQVEDIERWYETVLFSAITCGSCLRVQDSRRAKRAHEQEAS